MSQINDALNKAKQVPPRNTPNVVHPLSPTADDSSPPTVWLIPAIVIVLIVGAIFFIGWAAAHNTVTDIRSHPEAAQSDDSDTDGTTDDGTMTDQATAPADTNATATATATDTATTAPAPTPPPAPAPAPAPVDTNVAPPLPPQLPALQGIFYSATAPTAILDGKNVSPGDQFKGFTVKAISKFTVTLIGPDKKEYTLGMN